MGIETAGLPPKAIDWRWGPAPEVDSGTGSCDWLKEAPTAALIGARPPESRDWQHDWSRPRRRSRLPGDAPHLAPRPRPARRPGAGLGSPPAVRAPAPRGRAGRVAARPGSVASVDLDLAGLSQHVYDVGLEVGVVHAGLPELARVPVILPVVVPVAPAVGPEPVHVHLQGRTAQVTLSGDRGGLDAGGPRVVVGKEKGATATRQKPGVRQVIDSQSTGGAGRRDTQAGC